MQLNGKSSRKQRREIRDSRDGRACRNDGSVVEIADRDLKDWRDDPRPRIAVLRGALEKYAYCSSDAGTASTHIPEIADYGSKERSAQNHVSP